MSHSSPWVTYDLETVKIHVLLFHVLVPKNNNVSCPIRAYFKGQQAKYQKMDLPIVLWKTSGKKKMDLGTRHKGLRASKNIVKRGYKSSL